MELTSLPGHELVLKGVDDLAQGIESQESLLVSIGAPRLRQPGIEVAEPFRIARAPALRAARRRALPTLLTRATTRSSAGS